jgi:hypothetical protein
VKKSEGANTPDTVSGLEASAPRTASPGKRMSDMQTSNPRARAKAQFFQLPDVPRAGRHSSRTMAVPSFFRAGNPLDIPLRLPSLPFQKAKTVHSIAAATFVTMSAGCICLAKPD